MTKCFSLGPVVKPQDDGLEDPQDDGAKSAQDDGANQKSGAKAAIYLL